MVMHCAAEASCMVSCVTPNVFLTVGSCAELHSKQTAVVAGVGTERQKCLIVLSGKHRFKKNMTCEFMVGM